MAILAVLACIPSGVESIVVQQVKRNIAIFGLPALILGRVTGLGSTWCFATRQTKYCYFQSVCPHSQSCGNLCFATGLGPT